MGFSQDACCLSMLFFLLERNSLYLPCWRLKQNCGFYSTTHKADFQFSGELDCFSDHFPLPAPLLHSPHAMPPNSSLTNSHRIRSSSTGLGKHTGSLPGILESLMPHSLFLLLWWNIPIQKQERLFQLTVQVTVHHCREVKAAGLITSVMVKKKGAGACSAPSLHWHSHTLRVGLLLNPCISVPSESAAMVEYQILCDS